MNNIMGGIFLILSGVIFLLESLNIISFGRLVRLYWPMVLVVWGLVDIYRRKELSHSNGLVFIAGISLQLDRLKILPISSWSLFFGLSLILFGIIEIKRGK